MIAKVISEARKAGRKVGLCGQAPSDHPEFAAFLVDAGIDFHLSQPGQFHRSETACRRSRNEQGSPPRMSSVEDRIAPTL